MATVFKNPYTDSVMWTLQGGIITLTRTGDTGTSVNSEDSTNLLAATEQIVISQQRNVDTRTPLVGNTSIKIATPPQGQCDLTTLIGPQHVINDFMSIFGDSCHTFQATVKTAAKSNQMCDDKKFIGQTLIMKGCSGVSTTFTLSVQGGIAIAQGQFRFVFDSLDWESKK